MHRAADASHKPELAAPHDRGSQPATCFLQTDPGPTHVVLGRNVAQDVHDRIGCFYVWACPAGPFLWWVAVLRRSKSKQTKAARLTMCARDIDHVTYSQEKIFCRQVCRIGSDFRGCLWAARSGRRYGQSIKQNVALGQTLQGG